MQNLNLKITDKVNLKFKCLSSIIFHLSLKFFPLSLAVGVETFQQQQQQHQQMFLRNYYHHTLLF